MRRLLSSARRSRRRRFRARTCTGSRSRRSGALAARRASRWPSCETDAGSGFPVSLPLAWRRTNRTPRFVRSPRRPASPSRRPPDAGCDRPAVLRVIVRAKLARPSPETYMSQFVFGANVDRTVLSHRKRFVSRLGTEGDMAATNHSSPDLFAPSAAADASLAPAPVLAAGDLDSGPVPLSDAPARERARRRAAGATRDRADNRLFERFAATRASVDRDALVERFMPLARQLAASYHRPLEPFDDVFQSACYGLVKAVDRFELERGRAFTSYAVPTIVGEIKRHFRDRTWAVRVPRDLQELSLRVDRVVVELTRTRGRQPTVEEIADAIDVTPEDVLEAREAGLAYRTNSIDAPPGGGDPDDDCTLGDTLGTPDDGFARAEERVLIGTLMSSLSARERYVLRLRFECDFTQAEIGERIGVGQMQVSRILRRTISRLHQVATADDRARAT